MNALSERVLQVFRDMKKDRLDLHVLFEAAGNDPQNRNDVLDAVDTLVLEGFIEEQGSDFYKLTEKGRQSYSGDKNIKKARK